MSSLLLETLLPISRDVENPPIMAPLSSATRRRRRSPDFSSRHPTFTSSPDSDSSSASSTDSSDSRPAKRKRISLFSPDLELSSSSFIVPPLSVATPESMNDIDDDDDLKSSPLHHAASISADTTESVKRDVGPFLKNHIPQQYATQTTSKQTEQSGVGETSNTRYCYRHRPDLKCRRPADEPTMEQLQNGMETLPAADQQAITHVWTLFSAAPAQMRKMMLQGILQQCCFPQLSFLSGAVRELIRIDFLSTLPPEISFKILSYLDTASLCKAAQVSRNWRMLADDDVVWHKMCEQHIDRKCDKCGWGLPLLEQRRLRATKRLMELRAKQPHLIEQQITAGASRLNINGKRTVIDPVDSKSAFTKRPCHWEGDAQNSIPEDIHPLRTQPWKKVFSERYKVESNWRRGRCTKRVFKGHSDGIMCLQFDDQILATGSYDSTIKIWDLESGEEFRTLVGHTSGIRALQFDDTKLISGSMDRKLKIWNYRTGACLSTLPGHTDGVVCLHFDSTLLISGSVDKTIKVWNFADKSCFSLKGHQDWVNSVRISPTAPSQIFSASDDQTIKHWDLETRSCVRTFEGHVGHIQQILPLTPRLLISAALDGTVKFWDIATGRCTKTLFGHVEGVWALAADSLRVISGAQDAMVKVWDVNTGRCTRTLTGHVGPVTCVGLGDSVLVTGGEDCVARMYCFKDWEGHDDEVEVVGREGDGDVDVEELELVDTESS